MPTLGAKTKENLKLSDLIGRERYFETMVFVLNLVIYLKQSHVFEWCVVLGLRTKRHVFERDWIMCPICVNNFELSSQHNQEGQVHSHFMTLASLLTSKHYSISMGD
jgi:hypothetical protein